MAAKPGTAENQLECEKEFKAGGLEQSIKYSKPGYTNLKAKCKSGGTELTAGFKHDDQLQNGTEDKREMKNVAKIKGNVEIKKKCRQSIDTGGSDFWWSTGAVVGSVVCAAACFTFVYFRYLKK